jgi:predicted amidohydrolase
MAKELIVAAGQMGPASDRKDENLDTVLWLIDEAAGGGSGIVSLPELSLTKYFGHRTRGTTLGSSTTSRGVTRGWSRSAPPGTGSR